MRSAIGCSAREPRPVPLELGAVTANHRLRLHQHQHLEPPRPDTQEHDPKETIALAHPRPSPPTTARLDRPSMSFAVRWRVSRSTRSWYHRALRLRLKTGDFSPGEQHTDAISRGTATTSGTEEVQHAGGSGLGLVLRAPLSTVKRTAARLMTAMSGTKPASAKKEPPSAAAPKISLPRLDEIAASGVQGIELRVRDARVEGQRVVLRRIVHPEHGAGVEMMFRIASGDDIRRAQAAMGYAFVSRRIPNSDVHADFRLDRGATEVNMHRTRDPSERLDLWDAKPSNGGGLQLLRAVSLVEAPQYIAPYLVGRGKIEEPGRHELEVVDATAGLALRGLVRLRTYGDQTIEPIREILGSVGLEWALDSADKDSRSAACIRTALFQRAPAKEAALSKTASFDDVFRAARKAGMTSAEIAGLQECEVFPGYTTAVLPDRERVYRDWGVRYLFSGVADPKGILDILTSQGMTSPLEAGIRGRMQGGQACVVDIDFGGARGVFLRIATEAARGVSVERSSFHGKYQLVFDPGLMARCDWFAFNSDMYGRSDEFGLQERKQGRALIDAIASDEGDFASNNEIVFPLGVSNRHVVGILAQSEKDRRALIDELRATGIDDIRGLALEDAIQIRTNLLDDDGTGPFAAQLR
jgi:hypothetical protein